MERCAAGEELVGHHADGVDVDPVIEVGVGGGLLGRHVGRGADGDAGGGERVPAGRLAHGLGHAEVHDQCVSPGQEHVVGLDVPVDHALRVRERERVGDLDQEPDGLVHRELALAGQAVAEALAVHVGHHVIEEALGLARIEQRQDVRMLEPGGDADLAREAVRAEGRGELGAEHLDGDLAVVLQVVGQVDGGHAALAELALDPVGGAEGTLKLVAQVAGRGDRRVVGDGGI